MRELASKIGVKRACEVLNVSRSQVYRERQAKAEPSPRPTPAHALSSAERAQVRVLAVRAAALGPAVARDPEVAAAAALL